MSKKPLEQMQKNIVDAAAAAVVEQMTEEQMKRISEQVIGETLKDLSSNNWSLKRLVEDKASAEIKAYLKTEKVQKKIRIEARKGVDEALSKLSEKVKGTVTDVALAGMTKALSNRY
jgi:hypothetical protein